MRQLISGNLRLNFTILILFAVVLPVVLMLLVSFPLAQVVVQQQGADILASVRISRLLMIGGGLVILILIGLSTWFVTGRLVKQTEALCESEVQHRAVIERATVGIVIIQNQLIKYVNPVVAEIFGCSAEELIGQDLTILLAHDQHDLVVERYQRRLRGENVPMRYETAMVNKDGERIEVEVNAGIMEYHRQPATLAILRDITERKQAEESLRASEARYRTLLEESPDPIVLSQTKDQRKMAEAALTQYLKVLNLPQGGVLIFDDDYKNGTLIAHVTNGELVEPGTRIPVLRTPKKSWNRPKKLRNWPTKPKACSSRI